MLTLAVNCVGLLYVTLFTITPAPNVAVLSALKCEYWPVRIMF